MATSATSATTGTNINVASIVSQLMAVERRPLTTLSTKEASFQAKLSAFSNIKGALSTFQGAMTGLNSLSQFQSLTTSSSDNTVISGSASATAAPGSYALTVSQLAQSQSLASAGQLDSAASIGSGTLTFDFGTVTGGTLGVNGKYTGASFTSNGGGSKTVTIDAATNSLQGIRDAINKANIGVTASIVNDGSASPYRLALSSSSVGVTNSIKISVAESGVAGLAAVMAHDPTATQNLSETATAQNANLTVNGIAVTKPSNTITDAVQGLTLNLQAISTTTVNISVARDTAAVSTAVTGFVKAYNDLRTMLNSTSAYDPATKRGAVLQGDATVRTLQSQMRRVLNTPLGSGGGAFTTMSQVGVAFQRDGSLTLDSAKLSTAVTNNFAEIAGLFASLGTATDSLVSYSSASNSTQPGSYAVAVSSLASQGDTTGNISLTAASTTIAASTAFNVTLDGVSASVAIGAGTYTANQLAATIQSSINGTAAFSSAGSAVAVTIDASGFMNIVSNRYGSASNVSLNDSTGTTATSIMGTVTSTTGIDVVGTIGGAAATGSGQFLTSDGGGATGLKIRVNGGAFGVGVAGARGTVNYSQGYAYNFNQWATSLLSTNGPLDGKVTGINQSITDIGKQRDRLNVRLAALQKSFTRQYSSLDVLLSGMNQTSIFLTQQLANLPKAF